MSADETESMPPCMLSYIILACRTVHAPSREDATRVVQGHSCGRRDAPYLWTSPRCSLLLLTRCSPSFSMKSLEFTRNRVMKDRRFTHRRWALAACLCSGFGTSVISLVISFHTPVALSGFGTSPSTRQTSARAAVHGVSHRRLCRPRIRPCDTIEAKTSC